MLFRSSDDRSQNQKPDRPASRFYNCKHADSPDVLKLKRVPGQVSMGVATIYNLPGDSEGATVACHTELSNISQGLLQQNFANLPFEKSISVYPQNLWITLWVISNSYPLTWRCIRVFLTLPIFCIAIISIKNNMLP